MKYTYLTGFLLMAPILAVEGSPLSKHCVKEGDKLRCGYEHVVSGLSKDTVGLINEVRIKGETLTDFNELMSGLGETKLSVPELSLKAVVVSSGANADLELIVEPKIEVKSLSDGRLVYRSYDLGLKEVRSSTLPSWLKTSIKKALTRHPSIKDTLGKQAKELVKEINLYFHGAE